MIKKITVWIISIFMITTIVGCQKKVEEKNTPKEETPTGKKIEKSSNDVSIQVQQ